MKVVQSSTYTTSKRIAKYLRLLRGSCSLQVVPYMDGAMRKKSVRQRKVMKSLPIELCYADGDVSRDLSSRRGYYRKAALRRVSVELRSTDRPIFIVSQSVRVRVNQPLPFFSRQAPATILVRTNTLGAGNYIYPRWWPRSRP